MASITLENSYQSTNHDMGNNHIKAHSNQHKYLQDNEPLIETLTNNDPNESSTNLAIKWATENVGMLTEKQWKKYNSHLRKSRQKKDYAEYIMTLSNNFIKAKERRLNNPKTAKNTREKIARELNAYRQNGVPLDGSIYYLSNTEIYDQMNADQLQNYRNFEAETFKTFFHSNEFLSLNPGCIRAEIHYDENGALHLQTQDVWYHQDAKHRVSYAKRATVKSILSNWYGGEEALQHRLDVLSEFEETARKNGKKIGSKRADTMFNEYIKNFPWGQVSNAEKKNEDGSSRKYKFSSAERNTRLEELWRIEQMNELGRIAEETAKKFGINYSVNKNYSTDGVHLDGAAYIEHKKTRQKNTKNIEKVRQVQKVAETVSTDIKNTYKELSGQDAVAEPLSLTAKKIKNLNHNTKKEVSENQNLLQKQQEKITEQQRQLLTIQHQRDQLKAENKALKDENSHLYQIIDTLRKRAKSAGLIISKWVKKHWNELQKPLDEYAKKMNLAETERLHGGPDGKGDWYYYQDYKKDANEGLQSSFERIESRELAKSGFYQAIQAPTTTQKTKQSEDDLSR